MSSLHDTASKAAEEIGIDINDRRGINWEWEAIDDDVKEQIYKEWEDIIERHFAAYDNSQWGPISEAPKDGRSVIILRGNRPQVVAFYGVFHPNAQGRECWRVEYTNQPIAFFKGEIALFRELPAPPSEVTK